MNGLIATLTEAGALQVTDWELFQKTDKRRFFIETPTDSTNTDLWVKWDHNIQKYSFNVAGVLVNISSETF